MDIKEIERAIEAILFASGDPVSIDRIAATLEVESETVERIAQNLMDSYNFDKRGIRVVKLERTLQMCSSPEYADKIRAVMETRRAARLSPALLEVLAIVAYRQPVTRAYIEQVRGVDCSGVVSTLVEKGLIEERGRLELPGRPLLYGTTKTFLRSFSLSDISDLPPLPKENPELNDIGEQLQIDEEISAGEKIS